MTKAERMLRQLFRFFPILKRRFVLFLAVGLSGLVVQMVALGWLHGSLRLSFFVAQTTSIPLAMLSNFSLNNVITFRAQRLRGAAWFRGLLSFCLACSLGALVNLLSAQLTFGLGGHWLNAGLVGTAVGSMFNYVSSDRLTWKSPRRQPPIPQPANALESP
jgi:dolichol-phosphate mannosyltransferase